jgi:hypothetical protein
MKKMESFSGIQEWWRKTLHTWFVQYNPFYFFSASCVLFGMFLISRGLSTMDWQQGQLLLTFIMQLYEILLMAAGAFLFRVAGQKRSAVILGIIEVFFLFDCTLRTEMMSSMGSVGIVASTLWVVLVGLKLKALTWVFRLKVAGWTLLLPFLATFGIGLFPHFLAYHEAHRTMIHLASVWYGAILLALVHYISPRVDSHILLDSWGRTVLIRTKKAAFMVWAGFYFFHMAMWMVLYDVQPSLAHAAPFFILWMMKGREIWAWTGGPVMMALSSVFPWAVTPAALVVSVLYGLRGRKTRCPRFYPAAVFYLYTAVWFFGWEGGGTPEPDLWPIFLGISFLIVMALFWRLPSAIVLAVLVMLTGAERVLPKGFLQWGALSLAMGFVTLLAGFFLDWARKGGTASLGGLLIDREE